MAGVSVELIEAGARRVLGPQSGSIPVDGSDERPGAPRLSLPLRGLGIDMVGDPRGGPRPSPSSLRRPAHDAGLPGDDTNGAGRAAADSTRGAADRVERSAPDRPRLR